MSHPANALVLLACVVPLYTRIAAGDALSHATRARLHALIAAHPGATRRALSESLGVHPETLAHHLEILTSLGLVRAIRQGREVVYTLGAPLSEPPILRAAPRRELARLLRGAPRSQAELAALTGLSQRLVAYHLARIGALLEHDGGRPRQYRLKPDAAREQGEAFHS